MTGAHFHGDLGAPAPQDKRDARRLALAVKARRRLFQTGNHEEIAEPAKAAVRVALAARRYQDVGNALHARGVGRSQLAHKLARSVLKIEAIDVDGIVAMAHEETVVVAPDVAR